MSNLKPDNSQNLRIPSVKRGRKITLMVNGHPLFAYEGETVHAALTAAGIRTMRISPKTSEARGVFCGMGICYECLVTIDNIPDQRACMTLVRDKMKIVTEKGMVPETRAIRKIKPDTPVRGQVQIKARYHVIIVGCGIAGLSAADILAGHGLDILIIDENVHTGGQLLRTPSQKSFDHPKFDPDLMKSKGFSLARKITRMGNHGHQEQSVDRFCQAEVLGIFSDRRLLIYKGNAQFRNHTDARQILDVQAEHLILATGARERFLPFKGWTLPGVMSLGAAQILMKSYGVLPARHTLIAGTSPLQMALAAEILDNKGRVTALLDENSIIKKLAFAPLIKDHWPKLMEGAFYTARMILARTPILHGIRVTEARGRDRLNSVVAAKTTPKGDLIAGTEIVYPANTLSVGYGFAPNIELPVQAGCDIEYQKDKGGWVVRVDKTMESSLRNIYAAGEITGIAGAKKSFAEGKLAAISILEKLGKNNHKNLKHRFKKDIRKLNTLRGLQTDYAKFLNGLCRVPTSAYRAIPDDTIICRCEDITMGNIRKSILQGFDTAGSLKKACRSGMGRCQGRICGPVIFDIIAALTQKSPDSIGNSLSRAPVKNVAIKAFLNP
jgi:NADPH-dependent 2,4-dienoyl-CoA reductase/sulfur reductase-like enzyme